MSCGRCCASSTQSCSSRRPPSTRPSTSRVRRRVSTPTPLAHAIPDLSCYSTAFLGGLRARSVLLPPPQSSQRHPRAHNATPELTRSATTARRRRPRPQRHRAGPRRAGAFRAAPHEGGRADAAAAQAGGDGARAHVVHAGRDDQGAAAAGARARARCAATIALP
eukprot:110920-Prymnesium_polylepis.2